MTSKVFVFLCIFVVAVDATHPQVVSIHHTLHSNDAGSNLENIIVHTIGIVVSVIIIVLNIRFASKHNSSKPLLLSPPSFLPPEQIPVDQKPFEMTLDFIK